MPETSEPVGQTSIRRSFTLPTKLNSPAQRGSVAPAPNLSDNVIFYHPSAKIVHFAPRALVPIPSSSAPTDFDYPVDTIETLPWRSATERTVATAPLRLERVHGLTAFLKCGNVVHAILKNSQCWCVDGVSKFVLRIRPLTYYRIEIPYETEQDKELVKNLKDALPTVLRYEVTPCPFKRAFTVELPEDAMAPRRKKAWRPKDRRDSLFPASGSSQGSPSETRTEWLDSASTGEDTDGGATDDGAPNLQRTNSATSESMPVRTNSVTSESMPAPDQSPSSVDKLEFPSPPKSIRRSVTETPQTFTSLLAKFDAASVQEESDSLNISPVSETKENSSVQSEIPTIPEVKIQPAPDVSVDSPVDLVSAPQKQPTSQPANPTVVESATALVSVLSPAVSEKPDPADQTSAVVSSSVESEPQNGFQGASASRDETAAEPDTAVQSDSVSSPQPAPLLVTDTKDEANYDPVSANTAESAPEPQAVPIPSFPPEIRTEPVPNSEPRLDTTTQAPCQADAAPMIATKTDPVSVPTHAPEPALEAGPDHDSSFSSTPESFHSVDPASPSDSVSTHTPPELQSPAHSPETDRPKGGNRTWETAKALPSSLPADKSSPKANQDALRVTDGPSLPLRPQPVDRSVREDPLKPSLTIPSSTKSSSSATVKTPSPTDLNHMSSEFRRRAKATRERDISPMPPASAIYQPTSGEEASSFLSKALTLVLVPPVSLFIVLLHIAARIVVSPALNSTLSDSSQESQSSSKEPVTEDDFSFPLEREPSSEYEDAEITRKLDPWDLD
ncbi:hypothetical protein N7532_001701 [Penicillium argentinense]|uniref:Inheritance of peroxisomes protein 1 n=1 Tax=Penicillium argentinense TaxID=1131581 RepID=A0A9W9KMP7_9EURO|nr:uncharacterized protein N7532_001701 [Penicillium argentinense]KAJ5111166.1 hypothetical protein N7532_001701 [Penicillium argentinense]